MQKYYENEYTLYMLMDNIVQITYKKGVEIDLEASKKIVRDRLMFQEEQAYPVICDIRQLRKIDKPARDYLALEGTQLVIALAFIIEPPVTDAMTQFYLKTNHPDIPTASFRDLAKAMVYLGRFLGMIFLLVPI
jgi:hypothetical protein